MPVSDEPDDFIALTGTTCQGRVTNNNKHDIKDWKLRINIQQECYLNGFWNGSMEVHQFRSEQETVETVNMQELDISKLVLECNPYSDSLMIRLLPGDYIVFIPATDENGTFIKAKNYVDIGLILYYKGKIDLSDYELVYKNALKASDDHIFKLVAVLIFVWIGAWCIYIYLKTTTKRMRIEMNNQIRNMSIMADMYLEVYMIDVEENTGVVIRDNEDGRIFDLEGKYVQEKIFAKISECDDKNYQTDLMQFLDLKTVKNRMNGLSSIVYEWKDAAIGWCAVRLFCVGEEKEKIVFALQSINEEKQKLNATEERLRMAEFTQIINGNFMDTIAQALNEIANTINQTSSMLRDKMPLGENKMLADIVASNSKHIFLLQNTLFDMYSLESKRFALNQDNYNIFEMVEELKHLMIPFVATDRYEFTVDVDPELPTILYGDRNRLEQMLVVVLLSSLIVTQSGFVKFSVFGKKNEMEEELIFSVRDSGVGFSEDELNEINKFMRGSRIESFDNPSLVYLKIINGILGYMNSELKVSSVQGEGSEFYFTIKQKIVE